MTPPRSKLEELINHAKEELSDGTFIGEDDTPCLTAYKANHVAMKYIVRAYKEGAKSQK